MKALHHSLLATTTLLLATTLLCLSCAVQITVAQDINNNIQDANDEIGSTPRITSNNKNTEAQSRSRLLQVRHRHHQKNALTNVKTTTNIIHDEPSQFDSRRQLGNNNNDYNDGNMNLSFEDEYLTLDFEETEAHQSHSTTTTSSNTNPCQSIIAVDGYRLNPSNTIGRSSIIDSRNLYDTSSGSNDAIISYEPTYHEVYSTDEEFICELSSGMDVPIQGTSDQLSELRTLLGNGELVSSHSSVAAETITSSNMDVGSGQGQGLNTEIVSLPPGDIQLINNNKEQRRKLSKNNENMYEGIKKALLVRVTDINGLSVKEDAKTISDKFFGTYGDTVNTASQFNACSFGKLKLTSDYGTNKYDGTKKYDEYMSAPGVVDITIDVALTSSTQADIVSSCKSALSSKMGDLKLPGPFHHIIFIVEDCYKIGTSCNFAAYAYVNHWLSVFKADSYKFPAVVMHEIGHNLNLAHSGGTDGQAYTDHTCIMGNPLFEDNVGKICYNPVKNYQIAKNGGWYNTQSLGYFNSGLFPGTSWHGRLLGISDYENNSNNDSILLKLESGGPTDWFIGFNRASGINSESQQAQDLVTIHRVNGGDGLGYSQSFLKGILQAGKTATIPNWRRSGYSLVVRVNEINTKDDPGYADVSVLFGPQPQPTPKPSQNPTKSPSSSPSSSPTSSPSSSPTTKSPTLEPSGSPTTVSPSVSPTTESPTPSPSLSLTTIDAQGSQSSDIAYFDSGLDGGTSWVGQLMSVDELGSNNPSNMTKAVILTTDDTNIWYFYFDSVQVTIFRMDENSQSSVAGVLVEGQKEVVTNWRDSGLDLVIVVNRIDTSSSLGYAEVEIQFGSSTSTPVRNLRG